MLDLGIINSREFFNINSGLTKVLREIEKTKENN